MSDVRGAEPTRLTEPPREFLTPRQFRERHRNYTRGKLYEDCRLGRLPHVRIGRKVLIPSDALDQIVVMPAIDPDPQAA